MDDTFSIILLVILVAFSALFSATETAYSSLSKIRLKNMASAGNKKAKRALKISEQYDSALSAILIGNNIVNIASASIATVVFVNWLGDSGVGISTIVTTIVVLIFGEVTPKSLAKQFPEKFACAVSGFLNFIMIIFYPFSWMLTGIKNLFAKRFSAEEQPSVTEEELKYIIEEIEDEGVLNEHESELVQSALEFDDTTVDEVLTPRVDVVAIDIIENPETIKTLFFETGFSRLPVFEKTIDNIIGVLNEKDFIEEYLKNKDVSIKPLIQGVTYVPPKKRIATLLKDIQRKKIHLAVVTDEFGGTLGIITLEDIIEELVGDIWDESDEVKTEINMLADESYRVSGDTNVYDLLDSLEIDEELYDGESTTVGGLALEVLEKIPSVGDEFVLLGLCFKIESIEEQRVTSLNVRVLETENSEENE